MQAIRNLSTHVDADISFKGRDAPQGGNHPAKIEIKEPSQIANKSGEAPMRQISTRRRAALAL